MFTDRAKIIIRSGNGGHGIVSFRREKYIAAGGPDGGDGGKGGDVCFVADPGLTTLVDFRYKRKYAAENGGSGGKNRMTGKNGADIVVKVPPGTIIKDAATGRVLCDLTAPGERYVAAKGGRGGKGNRHFATATRQIPNFARAGEAGVEFEVQLELKLLADVGLVGFPNVGKSTILSVTTAAKPEIADYPFTTLVPQLGVVTTRDGRSYVAADIPGLIEGASEGRGAGHRFLRHIERTRLILHVVDVSGMSGRDPWEDFLMISSELSKYHPKLGERPQVIAANKTDAEGAGETLKAFMEKFEAWKENRRAEDDSFASYCDDGCFKVFGISALTGAGMAELTDYLGSLLEKMPLTGTFEEITAEEAEFTDGTFERELFGVEEVEEGVFEVTGPWIENLLNSVNLADYESSQYFQRTLRQRGVIDRLLEAGIKEGETVRILDTEFDFEL